MQRKVASYGVVSSVLGVGETRPIRRGSASGRAILDRQIIHIPDITAEREEDYADSGVALSGKLGVSGRGWKSLLCVRVFPSELLRSVEPRSDRLRTNRSPFSKPLLPRRSSYRERAAVQGIEKRNADCRDPGASDCDERDARHHQPLAHGCAARSRRHRRERRTRLCDVTLRLHEGDDGRGLILADAQGLPQRSVLMHQSISSDASTARSAIRRRSCSEK